MSVNKPCACKAEVGIYELPRQQVRLCCQLCFRMLAALGELSIVLGAAYRTAALAGARVVAEALSDT